MFEEQIIQILIKFSILLTPLAVRTGFAFNFGNKICISNKQKVKNSAMFSFKNFREAQQKYLKVEYSVYYHAILDTFYFHKYFNMLNMKKNERKARK